MVMLKHFFRGPMVTSILTKNRKMRFPLREWMLDFLSASKNLLALKIFQLERISEYFFFVQDLTVRFTEVHFFPGSEKCPF